MAIKLPPRDSLTLPELAKRWECSENDLRDLIVRGKLRPSFIINKVAHKVNFYKMSDDAGEYWQSATIGSFEGDDGKPHPQLYDVEGAYYLLHPDVTSSLDCQFFYLSKDKNHIQGPGDENNCFMLTKAGQSISLDTVFQKGMVMMSEVARFEEQGIDTSHAEKPSALEQRAEATYLNIIGGLLNLMLATTTGRQKGSIYESQAAIISALLAHHEGKQGISKATLENKFAQANKNLKAY